MGSAHNFKLGDFLPYRLSILSNRISLGISEVYQKDHDLSITEWRVMAILGTYPHVTASEIVQHTALDKVAISRAVKKLVVKKYIQKQQDDEDKRRQTLVLSDEGKVIYDKIIPQALDYEYQFVNKLSSQDFADLERILNKLFDVVKHN